MKKILVAVLILFSSVSPAHAAPAPLTQLALLDQASAHTGVFIDKGTIYTFGTIESTTTDAVITSYDLKGNFISRRTIDGGGSDYFAAGASDGQGNYWFVGGDAPAVASQAVDTKTATAINPDGVVLETITALRSDIKNITLWKLVLASGEMTRYAYPFSSPVLATALSVDAKGVSITGLYRGKRGEQNFLINASLAGKFGNPTLIGGAGTTINAVQRAKDGSVDLFGSSSEVLAGTKVVGKVDGVLIKVRSNKIAQVVRSSAVQAVREWVAAGASTFLVGTVRTGNKVEVAVTKFASFKPVWSVRYPSTGSVAGFLNSTGAYVAYSTSSGITLTTFSTKGVAGKVFTSTTPATPLAMAFSGELGVITLAAIGNQAALFAPTSG